jgi:hypothetical protein
MEYEKNILKEALIDSFVNEHSSYKKTIEIINSDLNKFNINFQYTYDQFCIDFLNQTLENIDNINIYDKNFANFYIEFWHFNLYNIQSMINKKLTELGYNKEDFLKNLDEN